jgi:hypothetical protein
MEDIREEFLIKNNFHTLLVMGNQVREQAVWHSYSGGNEPGPADIVTLDPSTG